MPDLNTDALNPPVLIDPADYRPTLLSASLFNTTSGQELGLMSGDARNGISIVQILDQGLTLEIPARQCARGHAVLIEIFREQSASRELLFKATAKVVTIVDLGARIAIELHWRQYSREAWAQFLELTQRRQNEVARFLAHCVARP